MEYSKIDYIEVYNFMAFKHAKMSFDEENIINLKGFNDSGKSAMERAMAVCLMDLYNRNQIKFIRHGEDFFRVIVAFDDGVRIIRDKYINGQSLYEMYRYDDLVYTTKEGNKLTKIDGVPKIIQDYLGLCIIDGGCLNYQTRDDRLWLVETKGSENYYSLNEILKTVEIARANTLINSDKNKLNSEIAEMESELQETQLLLANCNDISEELLVALTEREAYAQKICGQSLDIDKVKSVVNDLAELQPIPKVDTIDIRKLKYLLELQKTLSEIENLTSYPEMSVIGVTRISKLSSILNTMSSIEKIHGSQVGAKVEGVSIEKIEPLEKIKSTLVELAGVLKKKKALNEQLQEVEVKLKELTDNAKERGIKFIKCENCGSYMEVGTGNA